MVARGPQAHPGQGWTGIGADKNNSNPIRGWRSVCAIRSQFRVQGAHTIRLAGAKNAKDKADEVFGRHTASVRGTGGAGDTVASGVALSNWKAV